MAAREWAIAAAPERVIAAARVNWAALGALGLRTAQGAVRATWEADQEVAAALSKASIAAAVQRIAPASAAAPVWEAGAEPPGAAAAAQEAVAAADGGVSGEVSGLVKIVARGE